MTIRICGAISACLVIIATSSYPVPAENRRDTPATERLTQLVEANVIAVHAYQIKLAKQAGKGDPTCYNSGSFSDDQLAAIVAHQSALLNIAAKSIAAWVSGEESDFNPAADLQPILDSKLAIPAGAPVNVFTRYLSAQALKSPATRSRPVFRPTLCQLRAVANLYQTILEVDRDGDLLQQEFDLYKELGLPIYVGQLGLPGGDQDFLTAGRELAGQTCASPFDTDPAAWQIAGRKVWNWGEKKLHIRDEQVLAEELLKEPDVSSLIPAMERLAPQKIVVIGHSFTMGQHWSSPSSFVAIVAAMFAKVNPKVEFRQFAAGGLTASRAYENFYADALAWKPDRVLLVVLMRTEADFQALEIIGEGFAAAGVRACVFDNIHDPESADPQRNARFQQTARQAGMTVIPVDSVLSSAPDRDRFVCLDKIHMTEPYHRLMAREWLKFLLSGPGNPAVVRHIESPGQFGAPVDSDSR